MRAALIIATLLASLPAAAQTTAKHTSPPPPAPVVVRPRTGAAAQPAPPPAPVQPVSPSYYYYTGPDGYVINGAPYQVLSDGSVLVNFGNGYERVLRSCGATRDASVQVNQNGRDALGRILDPPGIAALKAGTRGQATGSAPARNAAACYRVDGQGRVEMITTR